MPDCELQRDLHKMNKTKFDIQNNIFANLPRIQYDIEPRNYTDIKKQAVNSPNNFTKMNAKQSHLPDQLFNNKVLSTSE